MYNYAEWMIKPNWKIQNLKITCRTRLDSKKKQDQFWQQIGLTSFVQILRQGAMPCMNAWFYHLDKSNMMLMHS